MEGQSPLVPGHQHEGRTSHITCNSQSHGDPLGEAGFSRSQLPGQQENVSRRGLFADGPAQVLGGTGAGRMNKQRSGHGLILGPAEMVPTPVPGRRLITLGVNHRNPAGFSVNDLSNHCGAIGKSRN